MLATGKSIRFTVDEYIPCAGEPTRKRRDWRYAERKVHGPGAKVKLLEYPKIAIAVDEILP